MNAEPHRRVFTGALVASFVLLVYMFLPFVAVLLTAVVIVIVSWPVYVRLLPYLGRVPAALFTTVGLIVVILGPTAWMVWLGVRELIDAAEDLLAFIAGGGLEALVLQLEAELTLPPAIDEYIREYELAEMLSATLQDLVGSVAQGVGGWVTGAFGVLFGGVIHLIIGLATWVTLYLEGPKLVWAIRRTRVLPEDYLVRLLDMFAQFAHNVMVGMLATTAGQGVVAAFGFWIAGAPRIALLGFLTAVFSQIPFVGSAVVWVPVAVMFGMRGQWARVVFVVIWSMVLTASVDNVVKPLVYRHGLDVHPVLVLLALLAGMTSFGPAGVLVGPLLLVVFLTLWTLYDRDVLRASPAQGPPGV